MPLEAVGKGTAGQLARGWADRSLPIPLCSAPACIGAACGVQVQQYPQVNNSSCSREEQGCCQASLAGRTPLYTTQSHVWVEYSIHGRSWADRLLLPICVSLCLFSSWV